MSSHQRIAMKNSGHNSGLIILYRVDDAFKSLSMTPAERVIDSTQAEFGCFQYATALCSSPLPLRRALSSSLTGKL